MVQAEKAHDGLDHDGRNSVSLGGHLGRGSPGVELRSLLQGRGRRYAAALRRSGPGESRFHVPLRLPPQQVGKDLALPGCPKLFSAARLLRLFGGRPEVARRLRMALFRPGQGPSRSLREVGLLSPRFRPRSGFASRVQCRQGAAGPARRRRRAVRLGRRPTTTASVGHHHLRAARARIHQQPELRSESGAARHLRRGRREDPLPEGLGRHRGGTHARLPVRPSGGKLLGLHAAELFRPPPRLQQPAATDAISTTNSAPWSRRSTPRTSRSSSTWSTTTRPKATSAGRSTATRESTTAPTT